MDHLYYFCLALLCFHETLLLINYLIYNTFCQALDAVQEVRAKFCDISKAYDRVWHAGYIHKLNSAGIPGNLLSWFTNYLTGRKQRDVMSGVQSAHCHRPEAFYQILTCLI